jgi:glyoxylase-like metal-dependent hydrolase (beta-lactamase superfamily II)
VSEVPVTPATPASPATPATPARPRKQEQEPASAEITEVAPKVLRLQIPINFTGLGHVNSYALIDSKGAAIVDAGLPGKETWSAIRTRLKDAGLKLSDIHTVLITHSHPDHFGSAGRLAHAANAEIVTERRFHTWFERTPHSHSHSHSHAAPDDSPAADDDLENARPEEDDTGYQNLIKARRTPWGGTPFEHGGRRRQKIVRQLATRNLVPSLRPPIPTRRVSDGDKLMLAGREWRAVHTPGHTSDHLCLYDPENELLLSGDHVLPTITPHVGGLSPLSDPLGSFLESLALLLDLGPVTNVLPAHGHPFQGLDQRVRQIVDHHDERLVSLREIGRSTGQATVIELSQQLFRKPVWGMMAESETYAHLEFLRVRGDAERVELADGQLAYSVDPDGTSSAREAAFGSL